MKSLVIYETVTELETLKRRAAAGETIYTVIDGKTMLLNRDNTATIATKAEVANIAALFPFAEAEEVSEAENSAESLSEEITEKARINLELGERLDGIEGRLDKIENALSAPILAK